MHLLSMHLLSKKAVPGSFAAKPSIAPLRWGCRTRDQVNSSMMWECLAHLLDYFERASLRVNSSFTYELSWLAVLSWLGHCEDYGRQLLQQGKLLTASHSQNVCGNWLLTLFAYKKTAAIVRQRRAKLIIWLERAHCDGREITSFFAKHPKCAFLWAIVDATLQMPAKPVIAFKRTHGTANVSPRLLRCCKLQECPRPKENSLGAF